MINARTPDRPFRGPTATASAPRTSSETGTRQTCARRSASATGPTTKQELAARPKPGWDNASMDGAWSANAQRILNDLQEKVTARDLPALLQLFEDPAVLIGTAGDGRTPAAREAYLQAVTTQAGALRWDWRETVPFFESEDALGFAAFGDVVLVDDTQELRAPIRATFFAVRANGGWRLRQFHGSIPQSPN